jgi:hypothetical protein
MLGLQFGPEYGGEMSLRSFNHTALQPRKLYSSDNSRSGAKNYAHKRCVFTGEGICSVRKTFMFYLMTSYQRQWCRREWPDGWMTKKNERCEWKWAWFILSENFH